MVCNETVRKNTTKQTVYKELNMRERIISNDDLDVNENDKKAIGLDKTTTLHVH